MKNNKIFGFTLIFLALIGAVVYLPFANKMGLYKDDWFLVYDAHTQGAQFFHVIYAIDRPARAYVMQVVYNLFGDHILYYHLSAYLWRVLAAWIFFWTLCLIWPRRALFHIQMATLFLIYPGFLSQINPIDYQAQILSLFLAMASIAFTVKSVQSAGSTARSVWLGSAILTGIVYPALVEYFIGLEILRLAFIIKICLQKDERIINQLKQILMRWLPSLIGPILFLIWRVFFFVNERRATDIGTQLGQVIASPLTGLWWLVNWIQDSFRVMILAWGVPLNNIAFNLRLRDFFLGIGLSLVAILITMVALGILRALSESSVEAAVDPDSGWHHEMLIIGGTAAVFALLPVILVNRHTDFGEYSRYALASAGGVAMFVIALTGYINSRRWQQALFGLLVFISSLTHIGNALRAAHETEIVRDFWWQVTWRAPAINPGTTLIASYPESAILEDYFIWGPANLIYYPAKQNLIPIEIRIPAAVLTTDVSLQILSQRGEESPLRRGNSLTRDFGNVLVLSLSDSNSCVRFLDPRMPELSTQDDEKIMLAAQHSTLEGVRTQGDSPTPPSAIFGSEPEHDWCYYYQKASLARQAKDWKKVVKIGDEAQKLNLHPSDQIEWLPLLQAYAVTGNEKQVKAISTRINTEPFYRYETCQGFKVLDNDLSIEMQNYVDELFCQ